jgi:membrane protease YdiL (CAAX protease family)
VPIKWIAIAITVPVIICLTPYLFAIYLGQSHDSLFHHPQRTWPTLILGQMVVAIGEEPGWRGFALPRLTSQLGRIGGTLVLGAAWAVWHLPLFMIAGTAQFGMPFVPFFILLTAWSLIMTLMVEHAHGSVLVAMLFHASANVCDFTMWQPPDRLSALGPWVGLALLAGYLVRRPTLPKPTH